ncbi:hypothetical protein PybrP1_010509 [[Pythium] brassicae (nom. inval.)]|nr:hypothetical protein PybrP1_010509 [[Pythium] brassicae (nom. inval.)]
MVAPVDDREARALVSAHPLYDLFLGRREARYEREDNGDDDGLGYTIRVSHDQVQSGLDTSEFAPTSIQIRDREAAVRELSSATSALRLLRNACVSNRANQDACGVSNMIRPTHALVLSCCEWVDVDDDEVKACVLAKQRGENVALQFLVNCVTRNERNQAAVWGLFFPDHFQVRPVFGASRKVLVECQDHRKIVAFTVALVLNCVNAPQAADSGCGVCTRRVDLRCLVTPGASAPSTAAALLRADAVDEQDPAFEWICVLFSVLFEADYAKDLYNAVGAHMLSQLWSRVTPEQLILLRMLALWVASKSGARGPAPPAVDAARETHAVVGATASPPLFEFLTTTWVYVITVGDEDRPEEADEMRKLVWLGLESEAKLLLLDALGELTQMSALLATEHAQVLLVSLLDELHRVWQLRRLGERRPATNAPTPAASASDVGDTSREPIGYRSGIIRAIGNLSFRHARHQDLVREHGHLALFLNHCNIDDANPLVREWALVALRNLCEGNEANQQFINALKPQSREEAAAATQAAGRGGNSRAEEVLETKDGDDAQ